MEAPVTEARAPRRPPVPPFPAIGSTRPPQYGPATWALVLALDVLPWPWGERILTGIFVVKAFVQISPLRRALRWAAAQPASGRARWRLALSLCAHHGLVVARSAVVGLRTPETWRPYLGIRGEEHLRSARGAIILLGFHLGMPNSDVALRMAGHRVRWLGGRRASRGWSRSAWLPFLDHSEELLISGDGAVWGGVLRRACRVLVDGETLYVTADGGGGREAFRVPLPGGPLVVRSGWLVLREHTRAAVLPVLSHREGQAQVVTIHPPLPVDRAACEKALGRLLEDYTRRFPEQCYTLAFRPPKEAALLAS